MGRREERYRHASNDPELGGGQTLKAGHPLPKLETSKSQKIIIIALWMEGTDNEYCNIDTCGIQHLSRYRHWGSRAELKNKIVGR
jgi:hypothetical protein